MGPLIIRTREVGGSGVFDLDSLAQEAFDDHDESS